MRRKPESRQGGRMSAAAGVLLAAGALLCLASGPARAAKASTFVTLTVTPIDISSPTPVADLSAATNQAIEGQVVLSWTSPDGNNPATGQTVASYTVKYASFNVAGVGSTTAWWNQAGLVPATPPTPQSPGKPESLSLSLEPGNTFYFAIESVDPSGNTSPIDVHAATPGQQAWALVPDLPPPAPTGLSATVMQSSITLTWSSVSASDLWYYKIHVDSTPPYDFSHQFVLSQASVTASTDSYAHTGLQPNTTYAYYVAAVDKGAPTYAGQALESSASNIISSHTLAAPPVNGFFTNVASTALTADWQADNNPAGTVYQAFLSTASSLGAVNGGNSTVTISTKPQGAPSADFAGLIPDTTYYLYVQAVNDDGLATGYSNLASTATLAASPLNAFFTGVTSVTATANWQADNNPAGTLYQAFLSTAATLAAVNGGNSTLAVSTRPQAAPSASFGGLIPDTTYYLYVQAVNYDNVATGYSNLASTATLAASPAGGFFTNVTSITATGNWQANNNPAGTLYQAFLSTASTLGAVNGGNSTVTISTVPQGAPSADFGGLLPDTTYFLYVQAFNSAGTGTGFTSLASTATLAASPVNAFFTNVSSTALTAHWQQNNNPAGTLYQAFLSTASALGLVNGGNSTVAVSTRPQGAPSADFSGLIPETTYYLYVQAVNYDGVATGYTNLASTSTLGAAPTNGFFTNVTSVTLTANWQPNGNPAGTLYQAFLSTAATLGAVNGGNSTVTVSTAPQGAPSANFSGLIPDTTYYLYAQAVYNGGGSTGFADIGSTSTLAAPPINGFFAGVTSVTLTANWQADNNPAGTLYQAFLSTASFFGAVNAGNSTVAISTAPQGAPSANFGGLAPDTTYFLYVQAVNYNGVGTGFADLASTATLAAPPLNGFFTGVTSITATGNWQADNNPAGTLYQAFLSTASTLGTVNGGNSTVTISTAPQGAPSASFSGLVPDTTYFLYVQAVNHGGAATGFFNLAATQTVAAQPINGFFTNVASVAATGDWQADGNPAGTLYQAFLSTASTLGAVNGGNSTLTISTAPQGAPSANFSGLIPDTTYFLYVQAFNSNGAGTGFLNLASTATLAALPAGGFFTAITSVSAVANWQADNNPAGTLYQAFLSTASTLGAVNGGNSTVAVSTSPQGAPSVSFSGLVPDTTYFLYVQAVNYDNVATGFVDLVATETLAAQPVNGFFTNVASITATGDWQANGNPAGTLYQAFLSTASALGAVNGGNSTVAVSTIPQGSPSANFSGLVPDTTYFLYVQAFNSDGAGTGFLNLASTATLAALPVGGFFTNVASAAATANWQSDNNPAGTLYQAFLSTASTLGAVNGGNSTVAISTRPQGAPSAGFSGLAPFTTYYLYVQAVNYDNVATGFVNLASTQTLAAQPINGFFTNVSSTAATGNWQADNNPAGTLYQAFLSTASTLGAVNGGNSTVAVSTVPQGAPSADFSGLIPDTTYFLYVQAFNSGGSGSGFFNLASTATLAALPVGGFFTAVTSASAVAGWQADNNPAGTLYQAFLSTASTLGAVNGGNSTVTISTRPQGAPSASFSGLSAFTTYYLYVQAVNYNNVATGFVGLASTETLAAQPVNGFFTNVTSITATGDWQANGNPAGTLYQAFLSTASTLGAVNGGNSTVTISTAPQGAPSADFSGLNPDTTYFLYVQAFNSGGSGSGFFNLASTATLAALPVNGFFTNVASVTATANWQADNNPAGTLYQAFLSTASTLGAVNGGNSTVTISTKPQGSPGASFSGLAPFTTYYLYVQAVNYDNVATGFVSLASTETLAAQPVNGFFTNVSSTAATGDWQANGNPAGTLYQAFLSTASGLGAVNGGNSTVAISTVPQGAPSANFSGLVPDTTYFLYVQAFNSNGAGSGFAGLASTATLAALPINGFFTAVTSVSAVANWQADNNPAGTLYQAFLSTASTLGAVDAGNVTVTVSTKPQGSPGASFSGLAPFTTYYLYVQAVNYNGVATGYANLASTETLAALASNAFFSNVSSTALTANWLANNNPAGALYQAFLSTASTLGAVNGGNSTVTVSTRPQGAPSADFSGLTPDTTYFLYVQAFNSDGTGSGFFNLASTATLAAPPAGGFFTGVTSVTAAAGWQANGNPAGTLYQAFLSTASTLGAVNGGNSTVIVSTRPQGAPAASFSGLAPFTTYYLYVQAVNYDNVATGFVNLASTQTLAAQPVNGFFTNVSSTAATGNWQGNNNPAGTLYQAFLSTASTLGAVNGGNSTVAVSTVPQGAPSADFGGLIPDTTYFLYVQAFNSNGSGSGFVNLASTATLAVLPVNGFFTAVTSVSAVANWQADNNPAGTLYQAFLSTASTLGAVDGGNSTVIVSTRPQGAPSAGFSGLSPFTTYYLYVQAVNYDNVATGFVNLASTETLAGQPVGGFFTNVASITATGNWQPNNNPAGTLYKAFLSTASTLGAVNGGNSTVTISTVPQGAPSADFSGLIPDTTYFLYVQAFNSNGAGTGFLNLASTSTLAASPVNGFFSAVTSVTVTAGWQANGNPAGTLYQAFLSTASSLGAVDGGNSTVAVSTRPQGAPAAKFSGLIPDTTYYLFVQAVNYGNVATGYSNLASTATLAAAPVNGFFTNVTSITLTADWQANNNPAGTLYQAFLSTASTLGAVNAGNSTVAVSTVPQGAPSADFSGLAPDTTYYLYAQAINYDGVATGFTAIGSTSTLAAVPVNGFFTNVSSNALTADWQADNNPAGTLYQAFLSTASTLGGVNGGNSTVIVSTRPQGSPAANFSGLIPDTTYYLYVQAVNYNNVATGYSNLASTSTLAAPPGNGFFTNVTSITMTADWQANNNPAGTVYQAFLSTASTLGAVDGGNSTVTVSTAPQGAPSADFSGLLPDTTYYLYAQAFGNNGGSTGFSNIGSTSTLAAAPINAFFTNAASTTLTANWDADNNPAGTLYKAFLSTAAALGAVNGGNSTVAVSTRPQGAPSADFAGLVPDTTYFLYVEAVNYDNIATGFAELASTSTLAAAPGNGFFTNVASVTLTADWQANNNPAGTVYQAFLSTAAALGAVNGGNSTVTVSTAPQGAPSASFSGLIPDTTYYLYAQAFSNNGSSTGFSNIGSTSTLAAAPVGAFFTNVASVTLTANWQANNNPAGTLYKAFLSTAAALGAVNGGNSTVTLSTAPQGAPSLDFSGLIPDTTYFLYAEAVNYDNVATGISNLASTATLAALPAGGFFTAVTSVSVTADWQADNNPAGTLYQAFLSTAATLGAVNGGNSTVTISTRPQGAPSAAFSGLANFTSYYLYVQAVNYDGVATGFVNLASTMTLSAQPSNGFFTNVASVTATGDWQANGNPPGTLYQAFLSTASAMGSVNGGNSTVTLSTVPQGAPSLDFSGLVPDTTYFLYVQAFNSDGAGTGFINLASTATLAAAPVNGFFSVVAASSLTASWQANNNPAGTLYQAFLSTASTLGAVDGGNSTVVVSTRPQGAPSANFSGLTPDTTYYLYVEAVNYNAVATGYLNLASTATLAAPPINGFFTNVTSITMTADWQANNNPAGTLYQAFLSTAAALAAVNAGNSTVTLSTVPQGAPSADFSGLAPDTTYYLYAQAINYDGVATGFVNLASTSSLAAAPINGFFTSVASVTMTANWQANNNPAGTLYKAFLSTAAALGAVNGGNSTVAISTRPQGAPSANFSGLVPDTTYYLYVEAVNYNNVVTGYSNLASTSTLAAAPSGGFFTNVTSITMTADWQANNNPAGTAYQAFLSTAATFGAVNAGNSTVAISTAPQGAPSADFSGLIPDTTYYLYAQAINYDGVATGFSNIGATSTLAALPINGFFTNTASTTLTANWQADNNPAGTLYKAFLSTAAAPGSVNGGNSTVTISTRPQGAPSANFSGLIPDTTYFLYVQAVNYNNVGTGYVNLSATATLAALPINGFFTNMSSSSLTANWGTDNNSAGTLYQAFLSTASTLGAVNAGNSTVTVSTSPQGAPSADFTGLATNATYYLYVQAINYDGVPTGFAALGSTATLADLPINGFFTNTASTTLTANWGAASNPVGTLYRALLSTAATLGAVNGGNSTVAVSTVPQGAPSADFSGLVPNTTYFLYVQAVNYDNVGTAFVNLNSTATLAAPPVNGFFTAVTSITVTADWQADNNPAGTLYQAFLSTASTLGAVNGGNSTVTLSTAPQGAPSVNFGGLVQYTTYYLYVQAVNYDGVATGYVNLASTETLAAQPVNGFFTNVTSVTATGDWQANNNPVGTLYKAFLSTAATLGAVNGGNSTVAISTVPQGAPSADFGGLVPDTTYFLYVQAFNSAGAGSGYVNLAATSTLAALPVGGFFTNVASVTLTADWQANNNPAGTLYQAFLSTASTLGAVNGGNSTVTISTRPQGAPSANFSGLIPDTTYFLYVQAVNYNGVATGYAGLASTATLAASPAGGFFTNVTSITATGNWLANNNPAGTLYKAFLSTAATLGAANGGNSTVTISTVPQGAPSADFGGLIPDTTYYLYAEAVNYTGVATGYSNLAATATLAALPVGGFFTNVASITLTANWQADNNSAGTLYQAFLSTASTLGAVDGGNATVVISTRPQGAPSANFSGLTPDTTYYLYVQAVNYDNIATGYTGLGSTSTMAALPIGGFFTNVLSSAVTANWSADNNPPGVVYQAFLSTASTLAAVNGGNSTVTVSTAPQGQPAADFGGLSPNTSYYLYAQAFNNNGVGTGFSGIGSTETLAVPPGPAVAFATFTNVNATSLTVNWSSGTSATGYNPLAGTRYLAQISTSAPANNPVWLSSYTYNLDASFINLNTDTTYYAQVAAINGQGLMTNFTFMGSTKTLIMEASILVSPADGGYTNGPSSFTWIGPSSATFAVLGNGAWYVLQVSSGDPLFAPAGMVIQISTPAAVPAPGQPNGLGAYVSTFTLTENTTYYWRVKTAIAQGSSAYSSTFSFITDFTSPTLSGFETFNSTGAALAETQWNNLAAGVTTQMTAQDALSGLAEAGGYVVSYSTNAGRTWQVAASSLTGANGTRAAQTISAAGLNLVTSTNTSVCGGSPSCGATDQLKFSVSDRAGNVGTAGPFAILVDTVPPVNIGVSTMSVSDTAPPAVTVTANVAADNLSGLAAAPYDLEVSTDPAFLLAVSSSNWIASPTYTFPNLSGGATYYARTRARDGVGNVSIYSSTASLYVPGVLSAVFADTAPASAFQTTPTPLLQFTLNTVSGFTHWRSLAVLSSGTATANDIQEVGVYVNSIAPQNKISQSGTQFVGGAATVVLNPIQDMGPATNTYFLAVTPSSDAVLGRTIGVSVAGVGSLKVDNGYRAYGVFPANSSLSAIDYGPSVLTVSTFTSLAPLNVVRTQTNVPLLRFDATAGAAELRLSSIVFTRAGGLDSDFSTLSLYKDANGDGIFEPSTDTLVTSGLDVFANGVSTLALTAGAAAATLPAGTTATFFLAAGIGNGAVIGDIVSVGLAGPAAFIMASALDTAASTNLPAFSSTMTIQAVLANVAAVPPTPSTGAWSNGTIPFTFDGHIGTNGIDHYYVRWNQAASYNAGTSDIPYAAGQITEIPNANGAWYLHARAYTSGGAAGTQQDLGPYLVDMTLPAASSCSSFNSAGAALTETQWNNLAAGTTVQISVWDALSGLSVSTGSFSVLYSTNAGRSFAVVSSTIPGASPYVVITGTQTTTSTQTLTAYNLNLIQSTSAAVCAGASPCGATDQIEFTATDVAGNLLTAGPFAVLVDTTPPASAMTSLTPSAGALTATSAGADALSGVRDFSFEASLSPTFIPLASSSSFVSSSSFTLAGLLEATTYYVRVTARDNAFNVGPASLAVSTETFEAVALSSADVAPAGAPQGTDVGLLRLILRTDPGYQASFSSLSVFKTGTAPDSDVSAVKVYRDNGDGLFNSSQDAPIGSAALSSGAATVSFPAQTVTSNSATFFVAYSINPQARVGGTLGAVLSASAPLGLGWPAVPVGGLPAVSSQAVIQDGTNRLFITGASLAPIAATPASADIPMLRLTAQTDVGTSRFSAVVFHLNGTLPSNLITAVKVYRSPDQTSPFDPAVDTLVSSGLDLFANGASTVAFTTSQASATVGPMPVQFFVAASLSPSVVPGQTFALSVATPTDVALAGPDAVLLSTVPIVSAATTVQYVNTLTASFTSLTPSTLTQGVNYAVVKATLTVDNHAAGLNRVTVDRLGAGHDSDVSVVQIYQDPAPAGGPFNPAADILLGQAPFLGGRASVNITTVTLNAGTTAVLFIVYDTSSTAVPGDTLGAGLTNGGYLGTISAYTAVAGTFPFATSTGTVTTRVNHLLVSGLPVAGASLTQGATSQALLALNVRTDSYTVDWSGLAVSRLGSGPDSDVSLVKVYADNGSGIFNPAQDALLGAAQFSSATAVVSFGSPQTVATSTRTFYVAVDVDPNAGVGGSIGAAVISTASFNLSSPNVAVSTFPVSAGPLPIVQFPNTITASTASVTPAGGALPGDRNVPLMKLTLNTNQNGAQWLALRLDRSGGSDGDVAAVKIYYDNNALGIFDPTQLGQYMLVTPSTLTFGSQGTPGTVNVVFTSPFALNTTPKTFFVTTDLSTQAVPGHALAAQAAAGAYFTVNNPNTVAPTSFASAPLTVLEPSTAMYFLASSSAPAGAFQGSPAVPMLSISVRMQAFTGQWSSLTLNRSGIGQDSDISRVKLYYDANGNGRLDPASDPVVSTGAFTGGGLTLNFAPQAVDTSTKTYFLAYDISSVAAINDTVGVSISAPGDVAVSTPNTVSPQGFPILSAATAIVPTQTGLLASFQDRAPGSLLEGSTNQLMMSLTMNTTANAVLVNSFAFSALGTASDADIAGLRVYYDANGNGIFDPSSDPQVAYAPHPFSSGLAAIALSPAQAVGPAPRGYFVAVDVSPVADYAKKFGLGLQTPTSISVNAPNFVVNAGFPMNSGVAPISKLADTLVVKPFSALSANAIQGSEVAAIRLILSAARQQASLRQLKVSLLGTVGSLGVDQVRVYQDADGDGVWNAGDLLVGTGTFSGTTGTVNFGSPIAVSASTSAYFVTLKLDLNAAVGSTFGLALPDQSYFGVAPPDSVSPANFPFATNLQSVLDARTPTQPVVTMPDGPYASSFESLHFVWTSTVAVGSIASASFAIGTTTGGADVLPYTPIPAAQRDFTAEGLLLNNGATYYVSVRATSDSGYTSLSGTSRGQMVDGTVPGEPPEPTVTVGANTVLLTWGPSTSGPSGLRGYLVEYRNLDSPQWYNAKTRALSELGVKTLTVGGHSYTVAQLTTIELVTPPYGASSLPHGTLMLRVRAVSGSGVVSAPSKEVKVQLGSLPAGALSNVSSYPNPFDSRTGQATIVYDLSQPSDVRIQIFSVFGGKVREMNFGAGTSGGLAGTNEVTWDGSNESGSKVSKGVYLAVITAGGAKATYKIGVIH